jgi:hypothetical protein
MNVKNMRHGEKKKIKNLHQHYMFTWNKDLFPLQIVIKYTRVLKYDKNLMKKQKYIKTRIFLEKKAIGVEVSFFMYEYNVYCSIMYTAVPPFTVSESIMYVIQSNTIQCSRYFQYVQMLGKTASLSFFERI